MAEQGGARATQRVRWQARWYIWDGGFLAVGGGTAVVPPHAHHALQVTIPLEGLIGMSANDADGEFPGVIVAADARHQMRMHGPEVALLFIDPESGEGRWLQRSLRGALTEIPPDRLHACLRALRSVWEEPVDPDEAARRIHAAVRSLCSGPPPQRTLDARVTRALEVIRSMDTQKLTLETVADAVFLSPSRFAHIFSEAVGLPFRRYVLWRRLTRAMLAVGRGQTLTAAAHACGFADSAHLTRACTQMFGQPPSLMMEADEFHEIPAPFELPFEAG